MNNHKQARPYRAQDRSLNESVEPLKTKAIVNQQRLDKIRYTLNGIAIAIIMLAIYMIWSK